MAGMQQVSKIISTAEMQALLSRLGARQIKQTPGKVAYQGQGGVFVVATAMPDGRQKVLITQGSCVC
jgi:hypothetical protein